MFGPFERAVAGRYLRARRGERFVSVIAGFSLVGIALGVATLIIVMSVMGGFKTDLLSRILGFNGHLGVYGAGAAAHGLRRRRGQDPRRAGRGLRHSRGGRPGVADRRPRRQHRRLRARHPPGGSGEPALGQRPHPRRLAGRLQGAGRDRDRHHPGQPLRADRGRQDHARLAAGCGHRVRHHPAGARLHRRGDLPGGDERVRQRLRVPAAGGGAGVLPAAEPGDADRGQVADPDHARPIGRAIRGRWPTRRCASWIGSRTRTASSPPCRWSRT